MPVDREDPKLTSVAATLCFVCRWEGPNSYLWQRFLGAVSTVTSVALIHVCYDGVDSELYTGADPSNPTHARSLAYYVVMRLFWRSHASTNLFVIKANQIIHTRATTRQTYCQTGLVINMCFDSFSVVQQVRKCHKKLSL